jgi:4-amino-4-deoxychorismate lyase
MTTPLLLETIKIDNGKAENIAYHQARCDKSRFILFNTKTPLDLSLVMQPPEEGFYRCRIVYNEKVISVEYIPYEEKKINHLKLVVSDIHYPFKYADRSELNQLLASHPEADEVIIVKDGLVTDTTISNLAFFDGKQWFTPKTPLLEGTMRAKLLEEGMLIPKQIHFKELSQFSKVALINAMLGFKIIDINTIINLSEGVQNEA